MYKTFFDMYYLRWNKDILHLSMEVTPYNASTFTRWWLDFIDTYKTELKIRECEFHKCNVSVTIWRNDLDSLTINPKDFNGDPIVSHKSTIFRLSKGNSICISLDNNDLVQIQKYCEEFILLLNRLMQST